MILPKIFSWAVILGMGFAIVQFPAIWAALAYLIPFLSVILFVYISYKTMKG